ncbi:Metallo-dependent phosphatase-like protein [Scleroderma citrinum]
MFLPFLVLTGLLKASTDVHVHALETHNHDHSEMWKDLPVKLTPPDRDLVWGDFNVIHTTDTHGWLLGHQKCSWPEPNYSGTLGDFASFVTHMKEIAKRKNVDLLLVDSGDLHDGTGLGGGDPLVEGHFANRFLLQLPYDIMTIGNHELYNYSVAYDTYETFVPDVPRYYLTSNVNINIINSTGYLQSVPIGDRSVTFTTTRGRRVTSLGVIYDMKSNGTIVQSVNDMVKQLWFKEAIKAGKTDVFVLVGHMAVSNKLWEKVLKPIRDENPSTPILVFGGHTHIRDCQQYDNLSMSLASGRFMETIGWMSANFTSNDVEFSRRYLDQNVVTYKHHTRELNVSFNTPEGDSITKGLKELAEQYNLSYKYGEAPQDYFIFWVPHNSEKSIWRLFLDEALPVALAINNTRAHIPNVKIVSYGILRYDIFKGPFTQNDQLTASSYPDEFLFIPNIPLDVATRIVPELNDVKAADTELDLLEDMGSPYQTWPEEVVSGTTDLEKQRVLEDPLTLGYVTKDSCLGKTDGDDTRHIKISEVKLPHYMNSTAPDVPPETLVDIIFPDHSAKDIIAALNSVLHREIYSLKNASLYTNVTSNQVLGLFAQAKWN